MNLAAGTAIGKYVVRRKLAEGGMAEVYLCTSLGPEGFQKDVVIKRVRPHLAGDHGFVRMFIGEAKLTSRLDHPNIVQIFDFDKHDDTFYLAMEYVRGPSLWMVRRRSREVMASMSPTLVGYLGAEVARGLHYAHRLTENGRSLGLVHRDVSPHNILLSYDGAIKLTDFGIAKAGDSATAPGMLKGKFGYMSPEQARGEPVDARTDLFALGIVLWEMLTGGRLFEGDSDLAILRAVQESVIAPPVRLNPDVPSDLSAVVMRALERDVRERFQSAQEMARALMDAVLAQDRRDDNSDLAGYLKILFPEESTTPSAAVVPKPHLASPLPEPPQQGEIPAPRVVEVMPRHGSLVAPDESPDGTTNVIELEVAARRSEFVHSPRHRASFVLGAVMLAAAVAVAFLGRNLTRPIPETVPVTRAASQSGSNATSALVEPREGPTMPNNAAPHFETLPMTAVSSASPQEPRTSIIDTSDAPDSPRWVRRKSPAREPALRNLKHTSAMRYSVTASEVPQSFGLRVVGIRGGDVIAAELTSQAARPFKSPIEAVVVRDVFVDGKVVVSRGARLVGTAGRVSEGRVSISWEGLTLEGSGTIPFQGATLAVDRRPGLPIQVLAGATATRAAVDSRDPAERGRNAEGVPSGTPLLVVVQQAF